VVYATAFDSKYLTRGIAMVQSLLENSPHSKISVLCLDTGTESAVHELSMSQQVSILTLNDMDQEIVNQIRFDRPYREFCWTLSALLCDYFLTCGEEEVVYLDADLYFFSDPEPILQESRKGDVAAIKHRYPARLKKYEINGLFNVQWVYFANTLTGRAACRRWFEQCVESCAYLPKRGIVGDQKYLDEWPALYPTFVEIKNPGAGVAPWNHETIKPHLEESTWIVDGENPLVFYHFHGFKIFSNGRIEMSGPIYSSVIKLPIDLYREYVKALTEVFHNFPNLVQGPIPEIWSLEIEKGRIRRLIARIRRSSREYF
jgi:hypothetical protein